MSKIKSNEDGILEQTTEIRQGHAEIGKFNVGAYVVITVVSLTYLILHFKP